MIINASTANLGKQLVEQGVQPERRESNATELIEQAKQVDQDRITVGAGETTLANREMPKVVEPAAEITPPLQTKTTMDSITRRYEENFAAMQRTGRNIDVKA